MPQDHLAAKLIDCDYRLLAAGSMQARLVFNAIVHQHLIPGVQAGAKVQLDNDGPVLDVFSVAWPIIPDLSRRAGSTVTRQAVSAKANRAPSAVPMR